jgi:hypothetical protein
MMMYRSAFPSVWSSPSNWKLAAVSVAPESWSRQSLAMPCYAKPDFKPRDERTNAAHNKETKEKNQIERGSGEQHTTRIRSRSTAASISSPCSDAGSIMGSRARVSVAVGIFFRVCFVWSGRWKVPSFSPLSLFFSFSFSGAWGGG